MGFRWHGHGWNVFNHRLVMACDMKCQYVFYVLAYLTTHNIYCPKVYWSCFKSGSVRSWIRGNWSSLRSATIAIYMLKYLHIWMNLVVVEGWQWTCWKVGKSRFSNGIRSLQSIMHRFQYFDQQHFKTQSNFIRY